MNLNDIIIIADDRYFSARFDWGKTVHMHGFHYKNPDIGQWEKIRKIIFQEDIFKELDVKSRSMLDAFRTLLTRDYPPLRYALRNILKDICRNGNVEGILTWCNVPSLELAAAECDLPVIHNEIGPFRPPNYLGTMYFDFKGVNGNTSAAQDMAAFLEDTRNDKDFTPISMEEMRRLLMMEPDRFHQRSSITYKSGVALQVEDDSNMLAFNFGMNNFELIFAARKGLTPDELLIRRHPQGYLEYSPSLGTLDDSVDSIEFILRCKRIICTNSSIAFEAMLLEKPVELLGDSPIACLSQKNLSMFSARDLLICLNFMFLGYLVPVYLLFDLDYYRWRLTNPSLREIYIRHLELFRRLREDNDLNRLTTVLELQ
ncbi:MAG: hypothetical protein JW793_10040 [Acidobacteria bacterium]|nr:hypothetical protein [Acidobacteriota bacterium]